MIKSRIGKKDGGFTIVELLVVIVVIGILATITIVAYTGITTKAKGSKAKQNADTVTSVANAYAADSNNTGYADRTTLTGYNGLTKLPANITVIDGGAGVLSATNGENSIIYKNNGTTGACIGYWDFDTNAIAYKYAGDAKTANLNIASPTCVNT